MFKKNAQKEFETVKAKIADQIEKLNDDVAKLEEEVASKQHERAEELVELQFDKVELIDTQIQELQLSIKNKKAMIEELSPDKSLAIKRAADECIKELTSQSDALQKDSDKLEDEVIKKVKELSTLLEKGKQLNEKAREVGNTVETYAAYATDQQRGSAFRKFRINYDNRQSGHKQPFGQGLFLNLLDNQLRNVLEKQSRRV